MKLAIRLLLLVLLFSGCSKDDEPLLSSEAKLLSFSIQGISESFSISSNKVEATLKDERDLKNLTAVFTISPNAKMFVSSTLQTSGYSKNDFSNPVTYIIEAEDGTRTNYTVSINFEAKLTAFSIKELSGIDFTIDDLSISATVPAGTDLGSLTAEFTITQNSNLYIGSALQESGKTVNDFGQPVTYDLKQNNETVNQYTVTISEAPNNQPVANAGENKVAVLVGSNTSVSVRLDGSNSSDAEAPIASFEWKLNGSTIGNTETLDVDLDLGIHNVELIVTDTYGDTDSDSITVEVRAQGTYIPIDANATQETKNLYTKLASIGNGTQFVFGQEFPLTFQLNSMSTDLSTSDCKDVTGDHPGVYGIDPHYMLYKPESEKQLHIDEAKHAYNNGSIVTFDFHQRTRTDHKVYFDGITTDTDKSLMYDIVNDLNGSRSWFHSELDEVLDIINNDLGFPIVFRLFHEMNGEWFWWGTQATNHSTQLYIDFYQLAVDYIKDRTDLVLFGWTPNQSIDESYYPGDTYVDVIGIDYYNPVKSNLKTELTTLSTFAFNHDKVAVFSETGKEDYVNLTPTFWTSNVLAAIQEGGSDIRIAWALAWFNAPWHSSQSQLYIPNSNSSSQVKDDFISFYNSSSTLFQQEVDALNVYDQ